MILHFKEISLTLIFVKIKICSLVPVSYEIITYEHDQSRLEFYDQGACLFYFDYSVFHFYFKQIKLSTYIEKSITIDQQGSKKNLNTNSITISLLQIVTHDRRSLFNMLFFFLRFYFLFYDFSHILVIYIFITR